MKRKANRRFLECLWMLLPAALLGPGSAHGGWDAKTDATFASLLCQDAHYARACFDLKKEACEREAVAAAKKCRADLKSPADGKAQGQTPRRSKARAPAAAQAQPELEEIREFTRIGECAGAVLEKKFAARKSSSPKCGSIEAWR